MKEKINGGIETIIAIIIITALVVILLISVVVPLATETDKMGERGTKDLMDLQSEMGYND